MAASDNQDNIINYAGDFRIKTVNILSYRKAEGSEKAFRVNLIPQTMAINFVEDVLSPCVNGSIDVADGQDFRTLLPITGNEKLELHLFTPGQSELKYIEGETDCLSVYKVDKIRISGGTGRQQIYRVHFTSREAILNSTRRISKAFAGPVENAVYEIMHGEVNGLDTRKALYLEPTATNSKIVVPHMKPFRTIKLFADNAISAKYSNAGYLFYETTQGFNFRSFESLMAMSGTTARPVTEAYAIQPASVRNEKGDANVIQDLQSPDSYSFENVANTLEELNHGLYGNRLVTHDIYNKKIQTFDYNYHEEFGNYFHTEHDQGNRSEQKFMKPLTFLEETNKTLSDFPMAKLMNVVDTKKIHNDYDNVPPELLLPNKISQRAQMANFHLVMTVPGQTRLNCGSMISFALPNQRPIPSDSPQNLNPYYSGRYLILSLKHKFDVVSQKHTMNLRCVKDATATELPQGLDNITNLTGKVEAISVYDKDERDIPS